MGKFDILNFLRRNPNNYYTADELSKVLDVNLASVYTSLRGLDELDVRNVLGKKTGHVTRTYAFVKKDGLLDESISELELLRKKMGLVPSDVLVGLLILKELKRLNKRFEDEGRK